MKKSQKIVPCIWYNMDAEEAVSFYADVFTNTKTVSTARNTADSNPSASDTVLTIEFEIDEFRFLALNGGSDFRPNQSISFFVNSTDKMEIKRMWDKISRDGTVRMALDKYDYSEYYGWIEDKYGVSWQLMHVNESPDQMIVPCFLFTGNVYGKAEEAVNFYTSLFSPSSIGLTAKYPAGSEPDKEGAIMYEEFKLLGQKFVAMESAYEHDFAFSEGVSLMVNCENQEEINYYWDRFTEEGKEVQCGWLTDKYGVSWQVIPENIFQLLKPADDEKAKRAMKAMMGMVKLNIQELEEA